jgi:ribosomal protein L35
MKIKAEYIGAEIRLNGKRWKITEGNESEYESAGLLFIFEPKSPKLKRNAKNTEIRSEHIDSDSDGAADTDSTILAV